MGKTDDDHPKFSMRVDDEREELFQKLEENLEYRIDKNSRTALIEESMKITIEFLEYLDEEKEKKRRLEKMVG